MFGTRARRTSAFLPVRGFLLAALCYSAFPWFYLGKELELAGLVGISRVQIQNAGGVSSLNPRVRVQQLDSWDDMHFLLGNFGRM